LFFIIFNLTDYEKYISPKYLATTMPVCHRYGNSGFRSAQLLLMLQAYPELRVSAHVMHCAMLATGKLSMTCFN